MLSMREPSLVVVRFSMEEFVEGTRLDELKQSGETGCWVETARDDFQYGHCVLHGLAPKREPGLTVERIKILVGRVSKYPK